MEKTLKNFDEKQQRKTKRLELIILAPRGSLKENQSINALDEKNQKLINEKPLNSCGTAREKPQID